jgi:hypothetical protein
MWCADCGRGPKLTRSLRLDLCADYSREQSCHVVEMDAGQGAGVHLRSGMMELQRVTMPWTEISFKMSVGFKSRITLVSRKL